jgi:hypothetical protein
MKSQTMLIDKYMPSFDVRHYADVRFDAEPGQAYAALRALDLERSWIVRLLFTLRTLPARIVGKPPAPEPSSVQRTFLESALKMGWVILEEVAGQELVAGAVTQPWVANVIFRGLPPDEFVRFEEPGYAKIVWNIAVRKCDGGGAIASTETRVLATEAESRRKFRRYWIVFSPGIRLIRRVALAEVRRELWRSHIS